MCFNHNKRVIFVGCADSFSAHLGGSYNSLIPAVYALECSGYELSMIDKLEVPDSDANLGVFTIHGHSREDIVFCTFTKRVLIAKLQDRKFQKFKVIDSFTDGSIYSSALLGSVFCGYCPKEESFNMLKFDAKRPDIPLGYSTDFDLGSKSLPSVSKAGPLLAKYVYAIQEFKDDIKFSLIDANLSVMFVFRQEIYKCIITRNSLVLDDKLAIHSKLHSIRLLPGNPDREIEQNRGIRELH
jgi:hypothetical protein